MACIAKGKTDKKYEFGNKVGLISSSSSKNMIILAIEVFDGNPHDSKTIEPLLNQMENNMTTYQRRWFMTEEEKVSAILKTSRF